MKDLASALGFLSIAPLPASWYGGEAELRGAVRWFPVVGLLFGAIAAVCAYALRAVLPPLVAAALLTALLAAFSGALHIDGLADTADGFFSARSRERMLEIMRDSRTGAMGVAAVVLVVLAKGAALASAPTAWAVALVPLAGRAAIVVSMRALDYARKEGGLATVFGQPSIAQLLWTLAILTAAGYVAGGKSGLLALVVSTLVTCLFSRLCQIRIGGYTGDTLGAACELAETATAVALTLQWRLP
jgi:adenosylcobinamide-GDP ribazoletransferase